MVMADIIHLIRHGQSAFNAAWEQTGVDPMIIDAPLTDHGVGQAAALRDTVARLDVQAVIASPLTRAIQTASTLAHGLDVPIHVDALHREYVWSSCDVGRSPAQLAADFPHLQFDHLDDPWWWCPSGDPSQVEKEPRSVVEVRVRGFLDAVRARPERSLAVVGHCTFFWMFTGKMMKNCEVLTIRPHQHTIPPTPDEPPGC